MNLLYRILILVLVSLTAVTEPTYSQKKDKTQDKYQPVILYFNNKGMLEGTLPAVIRPGTTLSFVMKDENLEKPTLLQKKLDKPADSAPAVPECLQKMIKADDLMLKKGVLKSKIDEQKKNPYQLTDSEKSKRQECKETPPNEFPLGAFRKEKTEKKDDTGKWSFQLIKNHPDAIIFKNELKETRGQYKPWDAYKTSVRELYAQYSRYSFEVKELELKIETLKRRDLTCCASEASQLQSLLTSQCLYLDSLKNDQLLLCRIANTIIQKNESWMRSWLWFTDGKPLLNPFGITSAIAENRQIEEELASAEAVLKLYISLSESCCQTLDIKDMIASLAPDITQLTREVVRLKQLKEGASEREKKYREALKSMVRTETVLNDVTIYNSDVSRINWLSHFDAKNGYTAMQAKADFPDLIYEKDALMGLVHNVPAGREVSAKEVVKEAPLRTELDVQTDEFADVFSIGMGKSTSIAALLNKIMGGLQTIRAASSSHKTGPQQIPDYTGNKTAKQLRKEKIKTILQGQILKKPGTATYEGKLKVLDEMLSDFDNTYSVYKKGIDNSLKKTGESVSIIEREFIEALHELQQEWLTEIRREEEMKLTLQQMRYYSTNCSSRMVEFKEADDLIEWLMAQTEPPLEDLLAAEKDLSPEDPLLRTVSVLDNEAEGSSDVSFEIFESGKQKAVATGQYKTYKTIRFWPTVSINYVWGSRAVALFDNTTGTFQTNTDIDNFEAVAGIKWYLGPSNLTRTRKRSTFISDKLEKSYNRDRGNHILGKTYLTFGLGVSHKFLKNYFLGGGVDLIPGLSVQGGANVFFRKAYEIDNGQVKREYDVPSAKWFIGLAIDPNVVTKLISIF